jgi:multidrug transporter EmrE-like cation transporter
MVALVHYHLREEVGKVFMGKTLILILVSVSLGVAGQLCLKAGMDRVGGLTGGNLEALVRTALNVLMTPLVLVGLTLYALAAVFWLIVLSKMDISLAYPMLALTYVLIPLAAQFILGEQMPTLRWFGIGIIFFGVAVVSQSG